MMVIGKLILKLGIEAENLDALKAFEKETKTTEKSTRAAAASTQKLDKSKKNLGLTLRNVKKDLNKFRLEAGLVITALTGLSIYASKVAQSLRVFTLNTGMSAQMLQEWQQQAALSGVSADEMTQSITGLQQAMTEIRMGGGNVAPFATLGVPLDKNVDKVLNNLKNRLKAFPEAIGTTIAKEMGLSEQFIAMLREMDSIKSSDKGLILTDEEISRLKDFGIYFNRVWDNIKRSGQKVGAVMTPIAHMVMWIADRFAKAFVTISGWIRKAEPELKRLKIPLTLIGLAIMGWVLGPVITGLIAIGLALEDIASYDRGENSGIGAVIGWFSNWRRVLQDIVLILAAIIDTVETLTLLKFVRGAGVKGIGEKLSEIVSSGAMGQYDEAQMAAKGKNGKRLYRGYDDKPGTGSETPSVNYNTFNINGGYTEKIMKTVLDALTGSSVTEGVANTKAMP